MTGVFLMAGAVFAIMGLGHCILGAALDLPFVGWTRNTYWALVIIAAAFGIAAWLAHINEPPGGFA